MTPPGGWELIVILFIVLLLFGSKKLPDLAGSVGKSIKEFRKSAKELEEMDEDEKRSSTRSSERDQEA